MIYKIKRLINFLFHSENFYKINELIIGGRCGLCGKSIPNEIFPKDWWWGICDDCKKGE